MILHDTFAMHRNWWDHEWKPTPGIDDAWTDWDFILADVFQVIQDYTDKESGQWMPFDQSGDVWWEVKSTFSGSKAALEKEQERELKPGESLYAVPVFKDPDNKPTLESWARDMDEGKADGRPSEHAEARPPTHEELLALREMSGTLNTVD